MKTSKYALRRDRRASASRISITLPVDREGKPTLCRDPESDLRAVGTKSFTRLRRADELD